MVGLNRKKHMGVLISALLVGGVGLNACESVNTTAKPIQVEKKGKNTMQLVPVDTKLAHQRIQAMIKFIKPLSQQEVLDRLASISQKTNTQISYVRPMSLGVHVIVVHYANQIPIADVLARIQRQAEVEYIEMDRPVRHQGYVQHNDFSGMKK